MLLRRAVAVVLVALVIAVAVPGVAPAQNREDPAVAVQALLDTQLRAINGRDREAFLATIDPQATESFRAAQAVSFDGLTTVPLTDHTLRVRLTDSGDLAAGLDLAAVHNADRAYLPETRRSYRIDTYDDRPGVDMLWWTYVERGGRWFVASDSDVADLGLTSARQLWDFGSVTVIQSPRFLTLAKPAQETRGRELAALAEEAMDRFQAEWGRPWSGRIPLIVPSTAAEASALLRTSIDVGNFAAFVSYTPLREGGTWSTTAPRIYAQEANLVRETRERQVSDLVHELSHAAASTLAGPFTPAWLHEGLAEYIRLGRPTNLPLPDGHGATLPTGADFANPDLRRLGAAYGAAASAASYLARIRGSDAPGDLFAAVGARRIEPGSPAYNIDVAVRDSVGMSLVEFEQAWLSQ